MRIVPIFVPHLGCPNDCVFCNQRAISGQTKPVDENDVFEILTNAKHTIEDDFQVAFYGGSFTAICESLQDKLLDVAIKFTNDIRISTRPDCITVENLQRLKNKKVTTIELGVQSMSDFVLEKSKRGHTSADVYNACKLVKENNFTLGLQIMIGLPYDTQENLIYTIDQIIDIKPDLARIYPIVVIENTELFDMYKSGEYTPLTIEEGVKLSAITLEKLENAKINVIRVGLNPSDDLSEGKAVAGVYHPAFGQMVRSQIYLNKMTKMINNHENIIFGVHKSGISTAVGQKRHNLIYLKEKYCVNAKIIEYNCQKGSIIKVEN